MYRDDAVELIARNIEAKESDVEKIKQQRKNEILNSITEDVVEMPEKEKITIALNEKDFPAILKGEDEKNGTGNANIHDIE